MRAMLWISLNRILNPLRHQRTATVLLADALLIAIAWHTTYLFRMGVERWVYERPSYDTAVLLGVIAVYSTVSWALGVPRAAWRYTSFHDIGRLGWVCVGAGLASAVVVLMAHLVEVPRAVLALHPVFSLITLRPPPRPRAGRHRTPRPHPGRRRGGQAADRRHPVPWLDPGGFAG
jgi:hypothetical protein